MFLAMNISKSQNDNLYIIIIIHHTVGFIYTVDDTFK